MAGENYTNTASTATASAPVGPADTTATLATFTGWPSTPFWGIFEKGTASAELVRVTGVAGSSITAMTRAQGGTSATSHGAGVTFEHVIPADMPNRFEQHSAASTGVHGVSGSVVGTTGNQTVQDKTFRGAHTSIFSDALPSGVTASYLSTADNSSSRDGFVHNNTAASSARAAFLAQQSGTDRFRVSNTGNVTIAPSSGTALTVTGNETVSGTLGVTGALTAGSVSAAGVTSTSGLTVSSGTSALQATTATTVSTTSTIHANGSIDTDTNLVVDGTSTLTGAVSAGAGLTVVQGITGWGSPVVLSVSTVSVVTTPVVGQVVYDRSDGTFKRCASTGPAVWTQINLNSPRFFAKQTVPFSLGSGVWTAIPFDTEDKDTANGHSTSTNKTRYTATLAGSYEVYGGASWAANANNSRGLRIALNGSPIANSDILVPTTPGGSATLSSRTIQVDLIVGDFLEIEAWQNSGANIQLSGGTFGVVYVGND